MLPLVMKTQKLKSNSSESNKSSDLNKSLLSACLDGDLETVQKLLARGADPKVRQTVLNRQKSLFEVASADGHTDILKLLLVWGRKSEPISTSIIDETFEAAACGDHIDIIKLLLLGFEPISRRCIAVSFKAAARNGNVGTVELLLARDREVQSMLAGTIDDALVAAAGSGQIDIVKLLLAYGKGVPMNIEAINQALIVAGGDNHIDIVKFLLVEDCIDGAVTADIVGKVLVIAAGCGHIGIVELLLAKGGEGEGELVSTDSIRAALVAASGGGHINTVQLLLARGGKPIAEKVMGQALVAAAKYNIDIVRILIERGVDVASLNRALSVNYRTYNSNQGIIELLLAGGASYREFSVLVTACGNGDVSYVRELLELGADANVVDEEGKWALEAALSNTSENALQVITLLLKHGADPNRYFADGSTPILYVLPNPRFFFGRRRPRQVVLSSAEGFLLSDDLEHKPKMLTVLKVLLEHGADPNLAHAFSPPTRDDAGSDEYADGEVDGYDVNDDAVGRTPLMVAVNTRDVDYIKLLLENGADVDQPNRAGKTVLELMKQYQPTTHEDEEDYEHDWEEGSDVEEDEMPGRDYLEVLELCKQYISAQPKLK